MENWLVAFNQKGGMPEAGSTIMGQLELLRMNGQQKILGVSWTRCMLYSAYAVLGVCCTQCYIMMMAVRDGEG